MAKQKQAGDTDAPSENALVPREAEASDLDALILPDVKEKKAIVAQSKPKTPQIVRRSPPTPDPDAAGRSRSSGIPSERVSARSPDRGRDRGSITPRSRTVSPGASEYARPTKSDRWGLLLFVAGLGALLGAIVYAMVLYTSTVQVPVMRLVVSSNPPGATIVLDGTNTGVLTPQIFQNIPSDREHFLELRLEGYEIHTRRLPASPDKREMLIDTPLRQLSAKSRDGKE